MAYTTHCNSIIRADFFKPLFEFFDTSKHRRNCPVLDDSLWLEAGVRRCLGVFQSGREFLQNLAENHHAPIGISTFFESLKSKRRLSLLDEQLQQIRSRMRRTMPDPFAPFKSLEDFDLYAGDGHFVAAACHDKAVPSRNKTKSKPNNPKPENQKPRPETTDRPLTTKYPTGHLYTLDLRTHAMSHLTVADQIQRNKEHEMRALKRQTATDLRQGAGKGRKVLYIWDRAGIDFRQWFLWKSQSAIYFLSRQKDNMHPDVVGQHPVDFRDPLNAGVLADEIVATSLGVGLRRVTYQDAATGAHYQYLTNLPVSIPPGLIARLYKSRWDIEKVFDEFKNKLKETKSWASSATAKTHQARLLCLTHNLLTLFEEDIRKRDGLREEKHFNRRAKRQKGTQAATSKPAPSPDDETSTKPPVQNVVARLSQRTVTFIRWLRNHLDQSHDWSQAIANLEIAYHRS